MRPLVAGKARHKLGESGGMLPQENFEFSYQHLASLVSDMFEAEVQAYSSVLDSA